MSQPFKCERPPRGARVPLLTLTLLMLVTSLPAVAALGGDVSTVQTDQVHMQGSLRVIHSDAYDVHQIQSPSGIVVREYVSPAGKIFGIAWQGPWMPDMQQLLGDYFPQYADGAQAQAKERPGHRPLQVVQPGFVLQLLGHMRSFTGRAYVPGMVPPGTSPEVIR
jgi:Protein of unknown function (DUF2844)